MLAALRSQDVVSPGLLTGHIVGVVTSSHVEVVL